MKKFPNLKLKAHVKIYSFLEVIGAIVFATGCWLSEFGYIHPVVWIGFLLILLGILWCFVFVKCPHCGSGLYYMRHIPAYCPDCGKQLD